VTIFFKKTVLNDVENPSKSISSIRWLSMLVSISPLDLSVKTPNRIVISSEYSYSAPTDQFMTSLSFLVIGVSINSRD
jgi:hypothetical protein